MVMSRERDDNTVRVTQVLWTNGCPSQLMFVSLLLPRGEDGTGRAGIYRINEIYLFVTRNRRI